MDKRISELQPVTDLALNDLLAVAQAGDIVTKKATIDQVRTLIFENSDGNKQVFHVADTNPDNAIGADGDFYLNRQTGHLFQKDSGAWLDKGDIFLFIRTGVISQKETVLTNIGTLNNLAIPTAFARFTGAGQVILTGVQIGILEGKALTIRNETGQEQTITHNSPSSDPQNTFWINEAGTDLPLSNDCSARFQYSLSQQKWQLIEVWGNGYSPHLVGTGERNVITNSDGTTDHREVFVLSVPRPDITTFPDAAFLNSEYPEAVEGFRVVCPNITGGGATFELYDEINSLWGYYAFTKLS